MNAEKNKKEEEEKVWYNKLGSGLDFQVVESW